MLDFKNNCYGRVFLDIVHLGMAIWGIYDWQVKNVKNKQNNNIRKIK
jgi:nicotinamide riboside transporter PnuC